MSLEAGAPCGVVQRVFGSTQVCLATLLVLHSRQFVWQVCMIRIYTRRHTRRPTRTHMHTDARTVTPRVDDSLCEPLPLFTPLPPSVQTSVTTTNAQWTPCAPSGAMQRACPTRPLPRRVTRL